MEVQTIIKLGVLILLAFVYFYDKIRLTNMKQAIYLTIYFVTLTILTIFAGWNML